MARKTCEICRDGRGFFARPCPSCGKQKALTIEKALIYQQPVGDKPDLAKVTHIGCKRGM